MKLSIATLASVAIAAPGKLQAQGRNQAGGSWSAEKSNKGVFYQEGGESFVAFASDFTEKGKGVYTSCITNGPCASDQIQYETYSFNPNTGILSASGTDAFGFFNSESTVDMATGTSSVTKTYAATGLVIEMVVEEVPDQSFMFFGEFTFTSNEPGLEGTGRFANAFVEDCQTSFDSRNEQPQLVVHKHEKRTKRFSRKKTTPTEHCVLLSEILIQDSLNKLYVNLQILLKSFLELIHFGYPQHPKVVVKKFCLQHPSPTSVRHQHRYSPRWKYLHTNQID